MANSLATGLESIALILLMRKRLNGLGGGYIWKGVAVSALGTLLMGAVVLGWEALMAGRGLDPVDHRTRELIQKTVHGMLKRAVRSVVAAATDGQALAWRVAD